MGAREPLNHPLSAALLGGAVGAAAGAAALSARAIARRNGAADGRPINAVLKTAATACELSQGSAVEPQRGPRTKSTPTIA